MEPKKTPRKYTGWMILSLSLLHTTAAANDLVGESASENSSSAPLFESGRYEGSLNSGVLFSPFIAARGRPTINYTITELQLGYMLTEVEETGWLRGNLELAGEAFGSGIFEGPGGYVAGATFWVRYNLLRPSSHLIPYAQ